MTSRVVGDHLGDGLGVHLRFPAVGCGLGREEVLHPVGAGALVERIAVDFETRIDVFEQRQGEIAHRMAAQVRRHEAQADLAVGGTGRRVFDRSFGRLDLDHSPPDPMLFEEFVAVLQRLDLRQLLQERGMAPG
jgi:hypothetical protein